MSFFDSPSGRPQGRAAALHQGRAQQPTRQPGGRAAALHQGRPAPAAAPSGRAAALHNASSQAGAASVDAGFDWSRLTKEQRIGLQQVLAKIRKADPYFDLVYRTLASAKGVYAFALDPHLEPYGQFVPNTRERGGVITFRTVQGALNLETTNEECFHAYQNYLYGRTKMARIGGSNIELEPKFFDAYKKVNSGGAFGQMPGQERMFNLIFDIDARATGLTPRQHQEYLKSVEEFRRRWEKANRDAHTNNQYDDPKTNDGPTAAFDIINKVRNARKK